MLTLFFGILLVISILVIIYMAQKKYENIDIYYWTMIIMIPMLILGYWFKLNISDRKEAFIAFSYIYVESTLIATVMFYTVMRFAGVKINSGIKLATCGGIFTHTVLIWFSMKLELYRRDIRLINTEYGKTAKMIGGSLHAFHMIYMILLIVTIVSALIVMLVKGGTYSRRTMTIYLTIAIVGIVFYLVDGLIGKINILIPLFYIMVDLVILFEYDHAHAHNIASLISEQHGYHETRGFAALDLDGRFLSCNEQIYRFLPGLRSQIVDSVLSDKSAEAEVFYELMNDYNNGVSDKRKFNCDDMICQCEISEFSIGKDGRSQGFLFDVRDVTEEQKVINVMKDYNDTLNAEIEKKTENIRNIQESIVLGLANMVENRDNNTGGHVKRTSDVIRIIVNEMQKNGIYELSDELAQDIVRAAPMHDIGKITIENSILCKPTKLTDEEFAIMKTHSTKSAEFVNIILRGVEEEHFVNVAYNVARYHHERWDGRGYPEGLVGEMIPLEARIMAVADVYDALISDRHYKTAMDFNEAAKIMTEGMGSQFDPNMLQVFIGCREELEKYYMDMT